MSLNLIGKNWIEIQAQIVALDNNKLKNLYERYRDLPSKSATKSQLEQLLVDEVCKRYVRQNS